MRDSGSVKLYWSLSCGSADGRVWGGPRAFSRPVRWAWAAWARCLAAYWACWAAWALLRPGLQNLLGLSQAHQPFLAQGDLVADVHAGGHSLAVGLLGQLEQLLHFGAQLALQGQ